MNNLTTKQIEKRISDINYLLKDQTMWHGHKTGYKTERIQLQNELAKRLLDNNN